MKIIIACCCADLDLYLQFEVADSGQNCLVSYATPDCGNAELVLKDYNVAKDGTADSTVDMWGLETIQISTFYSTAYTVWIGNYELDYPVQTSLASITIFVRDERLTLISQPTICTKTTNGTVQLCPYYDSPMKYDSVGAAQGYYPFAYPESAEL